MTRASTAALAVAIGLLGAARVAADPPPPTPPVPTADLPRIGTVGDFPAAPWEEVSVAADGGVFVDGELCDLAELRDRMKAKARAPGTRENADSTSPSRLSVVLRVAAASRWDVVAWVLQTLASPSVRLHRIFWAVRAEADGAEGAFATFLPLDHGIVEWVRPHVYPVPVRLAAARDAAPAPVVFAVLRAALVVAGDDAGVTLEVGDRVSFGAAIEAADLCMRAGASSISWMGSGAKTPSGDGRVPRVAGGLTSLQQHVVDEGPAAEGRSVRVLGVDVTAVTHSGAAAAPPKVARVRGVPAGSTSTLVDVGPPSDTPDPPPPVRADRPSPAGTASSEASGRAVDAALTWLAAHQSPDGGWEAQGFAGWCDLKRVESPTLDGQGRAVADVGVTGLALLAFLGAGYTNRSDDPNGFGRVVAAGLRYLKNVQDAEGCFGPRATVKFVYPHAIASVAMLEAYARTRSVVYKNPAQKCLDWTALARNPDLAWRYGVRPGDNDTSITGWMALGLFTARLVAEEDRAAKKMASLIVDDEAFKGIESWIAKATEPGTGRVGYISPGTGSARYAEMVNKFPAEKSEAMTAIAVLLRLLSGEDPATSEPVRKGAALIAALPPVWNPLDGSIDLYYWHAASLAMAALGGPLGESWRRDLQKALTSSQRTDGGVCGAKGSWDALDPWGSEGGRVYTTAIACLCLEAPARAARFMGRAK